jgi:enoyl-CoA hydratase/carnithine racemase
LTDCAGFETVLLGRDGGVVTITLNRPETINAANGTMWQELLTIFRRLAADEAIRVVVVTGAGKGFCSGADLASSEPSPHPYLLMQKIQEVALALHRLPMVTLAKVNGDAVGGGANLALGCDLVVASNESRFGEVFVRRGLSIDFGASWLLPRLIGLHRAKELCLTGTLITATEAAAMGLINRCVPADSLDRQVVELVEQLLDCAPIAQTLTKRLLNEGALSSLSQALENEARAQVVNVGSADLREAKSAFMARRPARFTGSWSRTVPGDSPTPKDRT